MENKKIVFVSSVDEIEAGNPSIQWCVKENDRFTFYESIGESIISVSNKVLLSADVVAENDTTYYNVFTIPLPASTFCSVKILCIAESDETDVAVQLSFKVSEATTTGIASVVTPDSVTTNDVNNLELSTTENEVTTGGLIDTNLTFPISADVALSTDATPGDLIVAVRPESGTGTVTIRKNSYYILT